MAAHMQSLGVGAAGLARAETPHPYQAELEAFEVHTYGGGIVFECDDENDEERG